MSNDTTKTDDSTQVIRRSFRPQVSRSKEATSTHRGRLPRVSKLMALAIHFEELLRTGQVKNLAELSRRGFVTDARITQIMALLNLSPEIQEYLLFLPHVTSGQDPITAYGITEVTKELNWKRQNLGSLVSMSNCSYQCDS